MVAACSSDEYVAPVPAAVSSDGVDAAAAAGTLVGLQRAWTAGDAEAARSLGVGPGAELAAAVADNVTRIGLGDVTLRYVTETGRTSGTGDTAGWDALVEVTWRVSGIDRASARVEVPFSFADGGRRVAAFGANPTTAAPSGPSSGVSGAPGSSAGGAASPTALATGRVPLWLAGAARVVRVPDGVVYTNDPGLDLAAYGRWARTAVRSARAVVGGDAGLVVEVPADGSQLDRALGVGPGAYDGIAAVTAPVDGSRAPGSPVHVFVNPDVFKGLDPTAAQVVMTHESVHALTAAPLSTSAPLWLVEGFADYVALRDVRLPPSRTAGQILAQVRADGPPKTLPPDTEFDTVGTHLGAVYEAAWQITEVLAERRGERALVRLYDDVLGGAKLAPALQSGFGWSQAQLTAAWQQRLRSLAAVTG